MRCGGGPRPLPLVVPPLDRLVKITELGRGRQLLKLKIVLKSQAKLRRVGEEQRDGSLGSFPGIYGRMKSEHLAHAKKAVGRGWQPAPYHYFVIIVVVDSIVRCPVSVARTRYRQYDSIARGSGLIVTTRNAMIGTRTQGQAPARSLGWLVIDSKSYRLGQSDHQNCLG